jgi:O-antigen/teichoic acid export membrane protein
VALLGGPLVTNILNSIFYFGVQARDVAPSLRFASGSGTIRIARLGLLFLVLQIVVAVAYSSDNLVIAHMLGAEKVAEYFVPAQMFGLVSTVLSMALAPLWPAYGEAIARGDHAWVKRTLKRSLFLAVCLATAASAVLVLAGPQLLALWVGNTIEPPFALLLGLGIWKVLEAGGNATGIFLNGANVVRLQVVLAGLMGVAAIALKIVLVERIGVAGVPWATILAYVIFSAVPLAVVVPRIVRGRDPFVESAAERQHH